MIDIIWKYVLYNWNAECVLLISIFVSCKFRKLAPIKCVWLLSNYWLILQKFSEFNWNHVEFTVFAFSTSLENFKLIDYIILDNVFIVLQNTDIYIYIYIIVLLLVLKNCRRRKIHNTHKKLFNRIIFFNSY